MTENTSEIVTLYTRGEKLNARVNLKRLKKTFIKIYDLPKCFSV